VRRFLPVIVVALAVLVWQRVHRQNVAPMTEVAGPRAMFASEAEPKPASFKCDGRVYCSQMTSCEEATYFLRNCPNVKMDGNNDGVPCERQWCGTK
jgi:Excalibur calcium-binding domain